MNNQPAGLPPCLPGYMNSNCVPNLEKILMDVLYFLTGTVFSDIGFIRLKP
jgi:hypothetical protein